MSITSRRDHAAVTAWFGYLDSLREGGVVNMLGAGDTLAQAFDLSAGKARKVLSAWMKTSKGDWSPENRATRAIERGLVAVKEDEDQNEAEGA